jgi:hypothetical protein
MDLSPSDKVKLIQRIGESLQHESLADLALTLDTFGTPPTDGPSGSATSTKYEYVLGRMASAPDPVIVGVHAHLYPDAEEEVGEVAIARPVEGPWKDDEFRLFLSHTDANRVLAGQIRTRLSDYGIDTYVAHANIKPTTQWQEEIEAALMTCDALAAVLTPDFIESKWCDQEVGVVLGRERCIIGVKQGAVPYGFISKYQAVNGDDSDYAAWVITDRIVGALWVNAQTRPLMGRPAAVAYTQSNSFDNARTNYARVTELRADEWTGEMVGMVEAAAQENRQVEEAVSLEPAVYGQSIPDLLSKHLDDLLDRKPSRDASDLQSAATVGPSDDDIPF